MNGLDMESGLARLAGDSRLYERMLLNFSRHGEETLADLELALRDQDASRLRLLAHKLRGVAGNLGALDVAQWAGRLEQAAGPPMVGSARRCLADLTLCYRALGQRIVEAWGNQAPTEPVVETQLVSLDTQLQRLLVQLQDWDGAALDTWGELASRLRHRLSPEEIAGLDALVQGFDFATARRVLQASLI